ncbi:hypothetical protein L6270_00595 [Candidatus Parcubacteria bacterium]|nr:hypothetical protein [Patescibacteria group bacterium]MBU4309648.1 hypothetical protein [Patescibacteria group bacterium]MBU4432030.1 hypothetical protein [Patescibacteria group bacterium]MBU4577964.1 hypothetical protein [Patescibacteria group bacterium]MCG2696527.1 hypothetical protein [Candidatus Parcubacteria bacterium]
MPDSQTSIKDEFLLALRANISFLNRNFPKNQNTNVCQNSCNIINEIEKKLKNSTENFLNISNNLENFNKLISKSTLFKKIYFDQLSDNKYLITVKGCELAQNCIHPRLNPEKEICPIALLAGSFLKYNKSDLQLYIEASKFTSQDSETTIISIN